MLQKSLPTSPTSDHNGEVELELEVLEITLPESKSQFRVLATDLLLPFDDVALRLRAVAPNALGKHSRLLSMERSCCFECVWLVCLLRNDLHHLQ